MGAAPLKYLFKTTAAEREKQHQFDVILCHAVAECLMDAENTLQNLLKLLKPDGAFSLMFYNKEAQRFHSLVSGDFEYVEARLKAKKTVGLTSEYPLYIE
ncbi:methyltransferase domain-containing protein [Shewanella sp. 202IG2-18]|uniref:methyltransferase n=1 Tax=Parashewanella hymeniacidonis TaxID=2807618 RepID=UPI001961CEDD|nr:methyltransferase [Parashewanella hymeniacidonis]MBM7073236.1 methyltransferase domain-containing protein [Parashewanella hymeniacidonis]